MSATLPDDVAQLPGLDQFDGEEQSEILSLCQSVAPDPYSDKTKVIEALVNASQAPCIRIATLSCLLSKLDSPWPILELIRCHAKLWKALPEDVKAGRSKFQPMVDDVSSKLKHSYSSILGLLPRSDSPALKDAQDQAISHQNLVEFIQGFHLPVSPGTESRQVVAVGLANGPALALAVLAVSTYYTALPVNASSGAEQFRSDVLQGGAKVVLVSQADASRLRLQDDWVNENHIQVVIIEPQPDLTFRACLSDGSDIEPHEREANDPDKHGILLFTSGTSGTKKLVPVTVHSIVSAAAFINESWGLSSSDICLNQMPLNHIGGILRNLFAPILAGGSTICCSAFDPNLFWDIVEEQSPTWYYASPTMHAMILEASEHRQEAVETCCMRLVCNAAGGLLPSLASQLRDTFNCTVLPSYGMTECMPISTPPLDYILDRPGTSGVSAGPEIAILDGDDKKIVDPEEIGRICIRGAPVFPGYLKGDEIDASDFTEEGWFDTGDMGYLDSDEFLYVTGRSKEVINRGGELISPFEVEDAIVSAAKMPESPIFGQVSQALAFSVTHNVLQEVVGIVLVTPPDSRRTDLRQLQKALKSSLQPVKWPVLIVYMQDVPKNNNKVLRIRLSQRLSLPELNDSIALSECHFEASCPPPNTALSVQIDCSQCMVDCDWLTRQLEEWIDGEYSVHVRRNMHDSFPEVIVAPNSAKDGALENEVISHLESHIKESFDHIYHPNRIIGLEEPLPLTADGHVDEEKVESMLSGSLEDDNHSEVNVEERIAKKFAEVLGCSRSQVSPETEFFDAGGDSLKAGKLLALLRNEFGVRLPMDVLFNAPSLRSLSNIVKEKVGDQGQSGSSGPNAKDAEAEFVFQRDTRSSTHPLLLVLHLIPLLFLYPTRRALTWTIFALSLAKANTFSTADYTIGRFFNLLVAMALGRATTRLVAPFVAIVVKWLIIGRYKDGLYPMWGSYHTKWWFVQKVIAICGMGHFSACNTFRVWYYRLLGARIGKNVTIEKGATLGEYDLIDIGDNSTLDKCICRPFAAEHNTTMYLGGIKVGKNCSIGLKSIVAAGSDLRDGTYIGPNSSSWECEEITKSETEASTSSDVAGPPVLLSVLFIWPICLFAWFIGALPWMMALFPLVSHAPIVSDNLLASILTWFSAPNRIGIHYAALIVSVTVCPIVYFGVVVMIRWSLDTMFGPLGPSPAQGRSNFTALRIELMRKLMPGNSFHDFVGLFGTHYEMTSIAVRALGGKVGERVYWPGTGPSITDYHLLDIGNDVVFGSRAALITSDNIGSDYIRISDGAMVSDRVVMLPGTNIGGRAVMGSGALTRRNKTYPPDSTWIGSKGGEAICLSDGGNTRSNSMARKPSRKLRFESPSLKNLRLSSVDQWSQSILEFLQSPDRGYNSFHPTFSLADTAQNSPTSSVWGSSNASESTLVSPTSSEFSPGNLKTSQEEEKRTSTIPESTYRDSNVAGKKGVKSDATSSSPFGRAFYQGKAPYYVLGQFQIFLYSTFTAVFVTVFWRLPTIAAIVITAQILEQGSQSNSQIMGSPPVLYLLFVSIISALMIIEVPSALAIIIGSKWALMGRRQVGSYDWDKSSYCQRWQLFLTIEKLRRQCFGGHGILGMLTGTHYAVIYFRALGAKIGKDCALFAGGLPSLVFTEPDLLTLGDRVSVDDASLVCHINSRGNFNLNPLTVGDRSVLRSSSRLLSGASMGRDTCLLEHTLVMAGDVVDDNVTMQKWPAEEFRGDRLPTVKRSIAEEEGVERSGA